MVLNKIFTFFVLRLSFEIWCSQEHVWRAHQPQAPRSQGLEPGRSVGGVGSPGKAVSPGIRTEEF